MPRASIRAVAVGVLAALGLGAGGYVAALAASTPGTSPTVSVVAPPAAPAGSGAVEPVARSDQRSTRGRATGTPPSVDPDWLRRTSAASGVPDVALRAYAQAQLASPPACHLGWTTLAGIGWVESQNGQLGRRVLQADGLSSRPILGPALDGTHGFAGMPATPASTAMSGDRRWVRAVGPLQFLPSTWARWAADGDGDGTADPDDIDDAALAAARYLCAGGRDLATAQGWTDAVLSYNHSGDYLASVHAAAQTYADRTG